ncbi:methyltransferase domain-containing protein [Lysobacter sp. CA199]|uniref:methyltransferase domain-containing protein n=1 Tax=Lysobacter sp. CA199 TaxID=3455608 RepID=UPI003F8D3990
MSNLSTTHDARVEQVQDYYGKTLSTKDDLVTNVCTVDTAPPQHVQDVLKLIHPEVLARFYGCGTPFPPHLAGARVLDIGCGSGRDCFVLSKLVGPSGHVVGVDATAEQIETARRHIDFHRDAFGHAQANVEFHQGRIESLEEIGLADESFDIIVSNCVINLAEAKTQVLEGMMRLLKPGGEIYFADIFSDRRLPDELKHDSQLVGECIGDVQYYEDFVRLMRQVGCNDVRVISSSVKTIANPQIEARLAGATLYSMTLRIFKLELEDRCEDYGQAAVYRGTLPDHANRFELDTGHRFETGRIVPVCRNTAEMLTLSRYAEFFDVLGNGRTHYGLFDCSPTAKASTTGLGPQSAAANAVGCGC